MAAFLKKFGSEPTWVSTSEDCEVVTEKLANGQRRIDIYLKFQNAGIIGIENKPWAGDQDCQLSDYAAFIKKEAGNRKWLLLYLSNSDPGENSITTDERKKLEDSGEFLRLSYADVIDWLTDCACQSKALVVRIFIEELAKFIRMNINGELDMSEAKAVSSTILGPPNYIDSAFQITNGMAGVKKELLNKFQIELQASLRLHGLKLDWDLLSWKAYAGFNIQFAEFPQCMNLRFQFEQSDLKAFFWGIHNSSQDYNAKTVEEIKRLMGNNYSSTKVDLPAWPCYLELPNNRLCTEMKNWSNSATPWISIHDGSLVTIISDIAVQVRDVFKEHMNLLFENDTSI